MTSSLTQDFWLFGPAPDPRAPKIIVPPEPERAAAGDACPLALDPDQQRHCARCFRHG